MLSERTLTVASSFLFLVPALYAFYVGAPLFGILAISVALVSTIYHLAKDTGPHWWWDKKRSKFQHVMLILDTLLALVFVAYGIFLFYEKGFPITFWIAVTLFTVLFIQFIFPTKKFYKYQHLLWHMGAAIIALLPLL